MKAPELVFSDAAIADVLEQSDWYAQKVRETMAAHIQGDQSMVVGQARVHMATPLTPTL